MTRTCALTLLALAVASPARGASTTAWFSDPGSAACTPLQAVRGVACKGRYCDDLQLTCDSFPGRFYSGYRWTEWFSEEGTNHASCAENEVMTGLRCAGDFCDQLSLRCQRTDQTLNRCSWVGPYSEEQHPYVDNQGRYMRGMWCTGNYCDNKWYLMCEAPLPTPPPQVSLLGYTGCPSGAADCNVCANDVEAQVADAFSASYPRTTWAGQSWSLSWGARYLPYYLTPAEVFDDGELPVPSHHVQGFARTNSTSFPYVGTYSDDTTGSLFILGSGTTPALRYIHRSNTVHPSGVHALGRYAAFAEDDNLRLVDLSRAGVQTDLRYLIPRDDPFSAGMNRAGGGIGLARLAAGGYLLVATTPGGDDLSRPRWTYFYHLAGSLEAPAARYLGAWAYEQPISWNQDYSRAENLSVITECGTGRLYVLHTYGHYEPWLNGYWRLSRVEAGPLGPKLRPVASYLQPQDFFGCHHRSAATAFVAPDHIVDFYCHEYDASYEGYAQGTMQFTVGRNYTR